MVDLWTTWVVSIDTNPTFKVIFNPLEYVDLQMFLINVDIYGFFSLCSEKGGANSLGPSFLFKKYNTNIDDV